MSLTSPIDAQQAFCYMLPIGHEPLNRLVSETYSASNLPTQRQTDTRTDTSTEKGSLKSCSARADIIVIVINWVYGSTVFVSEEAEYCQFETFNATCPRDHVIIMEHAHYGRPHTGRCITRDYGYVGCSMSVVHLLDRICSGRRSCQLQVPTFRDLVQPCPRDLITFLDASYHCVIGRLYIHSCGSRDLSLGLEMSRVSFSKVK